MLKSLSSAPSVAGAASDSTDTIYFLKIKTSFPPIARFHAMTQHYMNILFAMLYHFKVLPKVSPKISGHETSAHSPAGSEIRRDDPRARERCRVYSPRVVRMHIPPVARTPCASLPVSHKALACRQSSSQTVSLSSDSFLLHSAGRRASRGGARPRLPLLLPGAQRAGTRARHRLPRASGQLSSRRTPWPRGR